MIFTITLNPSLNKTVNVEELEYDDVNVILAEEGSPGGKGIDISRVIRELGGQSIALGFMGGYKGLEVEGRPCASGWLAQTASTLNAASALCLKDDVYAIKKEVSARNT